MWWWTPSAVGRRRAAHRSSAAVPQGVAPRTVLVDTTPTFVDGVPFVPVAPAAAFAVALRAGYPANPVALAAAFPLFREHSPVVVDDAPSGKFVDEPHTSKTPCGPAAFPDVPEVRRRRPRVYRVTVAPRRLLQLRCAGFRLVSTHVPPYTAGTTWSTVSAPGWPQMWQTVERARTRARTLRWRDPRPRLDGDFGSWWCLHLPR
jgi:hypothetical protein